jgi:hypothetical protein
MAKNLIYNQGSPNIDLLTTPDKVILLSDYQPTGSSVTYAKTKVDYASILNSAVDQVWALADNPAYAGKIILPTEMPDPRRLTNNIEAIAFSGDVTDYLAAQAWMLKQFAGEYATVATVTNLWAGPWAGAQSMLTATPSQVEEFANSAINAYNMLGWSKANPYLDFIAFDKYERDETSGQVITGTYGAYAFTETAWNNALHFYNALAPGVMPADKLAIMLWQIPSSGLPSGDPHDIPMLNQGWDQGAAYAASDVPHFGITQSYCFGKDLLDSAGIAERVHNISFNDPFGKTIVYGERITQDSTWSPSVGLIDPSSGAMDASLDNVFAVLWGGGNTSAPVS